MADLRTDLGRIVLKNPVMTASGTFGYGREYHEFFDISRLGAVVVKGIRMTPSAGNPTPRVAEVASGMLNAIGLQGPGVEHFLHDEAYLPFLRSVGATVIVNIWGTTVEEYAEVAAALEAGAAGAIAALEINISCPNVKAGGVAFGTDPKRAAQVVSRVRAATSLPLITKLSPNVTDIAEFARAAEAAGSDMISDCVFTSSMLCAIPSSRAVKNAVRGWSPVIITVFIPARRQISMASFAPLRGGSVIPAQPA